MILQHYTPPRGQNEQTVKNKTNKNPTKRQTEAGIQREKDKQAGRLSQFCQSLFADKKQKIYEEKKYFPGEF